MEFGVGIPGTLAGAIVTNAGAHNEELGHYVQWVDVLDAQGSAVGEDEAFALPQLRRYMQADLQLDNRNSRFRERRRALISASVQLVPAPRPMITPPEIILRLAISLYRDGAQQIDHRLDGFRASHWRQIDAFAGTIGDRSGSRY